jgi:hypothetical protein
MIERLQHLTSSQGRGAWDSWLSPFSLLPGRATRPWERRSGWSHRRGDCHGSQLPGRSPYTSQKRYPTPPLRVGSAPVATNGIGFTRRPSRHNRQPIVLVKVLPVVYGVPLPWFFVATSERLTWCSKLTPLKRWRLSQGRGTWACATKGSLCIATLSCAVGR